MKRLNQILIVLIVLMAGLDAALLYAAPPTIKSAVLCLQDRDGKQIGDCVEIERPITTSKITFKWERGLVDGKPQTTKVFGYRLYFGKTTEEAVTKTAPNLVLPDLKNRPNFDVQPQKLELVLHNPGKVHGFKAGDQFCVTVTEHDGTDEGDRPDPLCVFLEN